MRKLLIRATHELASRLENKLRHNYDVRVHVLDDRTTSVVCEISAEVPKKMGNRLQVCPYREFGRYFNNV